LVIVSITAYGHAFGASESVLWGFGNSSPGANPHAGLIMDASGNLYGTTIGGGDDVNEFGLAGTVFEIYKVPPPPPPPPGTATVSTTEIGFYSVGIGTPPRVRR
jgi:hypothetical protein